MTDPRDTDPVDRSTPEDRQLSRRSQGTPMTLLVVAVIALVVAGAYVVFALL